MILHLQTVYSLIEALRRTYRKDLCSYLVILIDEHRNRICYSQSKTAEPKKLKFGHMRIKKSIMRANLGNSGSLRSSGRDSGNKKAGANGYFRIGILLIR